MGQKGNGEWNGKARAWGNHEGRGVLRGKGEMCVWRLIEGEARERWCEVTGQVLRQGGGESTVGTYCCNELLSCFSCSSHAWGHWGGAILETVYSHFREIGTNWYHPDHKRSVSTELGIHSEFINSMPIVNWHYYHKLVWTVKFLVSSSYTCRNWVDMETN